MNYPLEPSSPEVREMLEQITNKLVQWLDDIEQSSSYDVDESRQLAELQSQKLPTQKEPLEKLLQDIFESKVPHALPTASPGFMAYIPGGGIVHAALAELITKVTNRYVGIDATAPFLSQIETDVIKWFCQMIGYSEYSGGTLTSGGSIANLTGVICARTIVMGDEFAKGVVYASEFVHHSMWKAFQAAGIVKSQIRNVPVDQSFKLDVKKLSLQMAEDKAGGFQPMMVVATAGSTNTGSVDDLVAIAKLCKEFGAWYHIDAAYGGFFSMIEQGKQKLRGIELADSITLDPHKGLFLPYGTGAFIAKDRELLKSVFSHQADYIPDKSGTQALWDFSEMSLELTRPSRGLAIWLPFKMLGATAFKDTLQEKLDLADYFFKEISKDKRWKILAEPELSLTVFKFSNENLSMEELNGINKVIIDKVNEKGRANLSGTLINGHFVIRTCILSFRTHKKHVDWLLQDLKQCLVSYI